MFMVESIVMRWSVDPWTQRPPVEVVPLTSLVSETLVPLVAYVPVSFSEPAAVSIQVQLLDPTHVNVDPAGSWD